MYSRCEECQDNSIPYAGIPRRPKPRVSRIDPVRGIREIDVDMHVPPDVAVAGLRKLVCHRLRAIRDNLILEPRKAALTCIWSVWLDIRLAGPPRRSPRCM